MNHSLKPKEKQVLDYITKILSTEGYAPSVRDICSALGFKSTSTVHMYIERLEAKGYIQKESGKSRTLRVDNKGASSGSKHYQVPVVGTVAAGTPILTVENYDGYVDFSSDRSFSLNSLFALKVKGDSMIEIGILNGDTVIVEKREYAENGEIVVAMIDDEATVKRFYKEDGHFRLQPENASFDPIITDEVTILGKVVALVRTYHQ